MADGADAEGGLSVKAFPDGSALAGPRLDLEPLRVEHAEEMTPLLDDPGPHVFTGGEPASLPELRERYRRQAVGGSRDGSQRGALLAHVHPDHQASQRVARAVGFTATTTTVSEETRWQG